MKTAKLTALFVTAGLSLGITTQAVFAQTQGKTRTEVVNELKWALHDGVMPTNKTQYPPSAEIVARNKELHGITVHAGEKTPQVDNHDSVATR